jgi:hypothetical protein
VSIGDEELARQVEVYPNPTGGLFWISAESLDAEDLRIEVLDGRGRVVHSWHGGTLRGMLRHEVDLSGEAKGVYQVRILDGSRSASKRIMRR